MDKSNRTEKESRTLDQSLAVSLEYHGEGAPTVTAKGKGHLAEEIIEIAKAHDIPIKSDDQLVALLSQVELDEEIPQALYEAVVQVLIFAYQITGKQPFEDEDAPN
ncbi:MAG: EscU/YscU/HrcU family type III secretion system export apparatus switch protein [Hydrogenovibrio sp.]|nr:EscU/YscU/HrcU family type III secretion system export apparatus switch protein [Hydrogenovibrio sp.]